jgi:hypothetical protein
MRVWEALRVTEGRYVLMLTHWGDQAGLNWEWEMERDRRENVRYGEDRARRTVRWRGEQCRGWWTVVS